MSTQVVFIHDMLIPPFKPKLLHIVNLLARVKTRQHKSYKHTTDNICLKLNTRSVQSIYFELFRHVDAKIYHFMIPLGLE